tara:strand:- start:208 stop:411 length:204 start_codon:yes stop_codon:yes gene_type:complete
MNVGDKVTHWNYGEAVVIATPRGAWDVPWEWKHNWEAVVRIRHTSTGGVWKEWVVVEDLDRIKGVEV